MRFATQYSAVGIMPSASGHESYEMALDFDVNCQNSSKITYSSTRRRARAAVVAPVGVPGGGGRRRRALGRFRGGGERAEHLRRDDRGAQGVERPFSSIFASL